MFGILDAIKARLARKRAERRSYPPCPMVTSRGQIFWTSRDLLFPPGSPPKASPSSHQKK